MNSLRLPLALVAAALMLGAPAAMLGTPAARQPAPSAPLSAGQQPPPSAGGASTKGMAMQDARAEALKTKGKKAYYTRTFDLSGIPAYEPEQPVSGTLRMWGSNYPADGLLAGYWEETFRRYHPAIKFEFHLKSTAGTIPGLVTGQSDLGPGVKATFAGLQFYQRYLDADPLEIVYATGSYDVTGWSPGYGIVVHKDNPITKITMEQLDGIFGAERLGGWVGTDWHPEYARGPEKNIRTWGQLGLTGEWADKPIVPYGLNLRYHQATVISDRILKGSDKWNERLRTYANYVTPNGALSRGLNDDLRKDKYGIAYVAAPTAAANFGSSFGSRGDKAPPELKILALAETAAGPYVEYTLETLQNRTYPLYDEVYFYAHALPGRSVDPKVKEFMRFLVSREGQELVMKDGKYLPLTAAVAREQLKRLQSAATF
jgi:phosphate transport system substrate-binding protein